MAIEDLARLSTGWRIWSRRRGGLVVGLRAGRPHRRQPLRQRHPVARRHRGDLRAGAARRAGPTSPCSRAAARRPPRLPAATAAPTSPRCVSQPPRRPGSAANLPVPAPWRSPSAVTAPAAAPRDSAWSPHRLGPPWHSRRADASTALIRLDRPPVQRRGRRPGAGPAAAGLLGMSTARAAPPRPGDPGRDDRAGARPAAVRRAASPRGWLGVGVAARGAARHDARPPPAAAPA